MMNVEIGSFLDLDIRNSGEYYQGEINIARLNSARAGIHHSCRLYNCSSIHLPHYLCPTVKEFLLNHGVAVDPYFISEKFEPLNLNQKDGSAVLLVNYFGIFSVNRMKMLARNFKNVIIDNSAAFYCDPFDNVYSVYSPRKFFGVPDGCYVIGTEANKFTHDYEQDFSSITASFLLKRIEFGLKDTYSERMKNEERINNSDILQMSRLTRSMLNNIDYAKIKQKRKRNFRFAHELFRMINKIDPLTYYGKDCVPLIYPLVLERDNLDDILKKNQIFTGRWWKNVLSEVPDSTFEARLSRFMIPTPIDQRYDRNEIEYIKHVLISNREINA